jgi:hypothetical protein
MTFLSGAAKRAAVAVALSATLATAGCSSAAPGVVAYVGDSQITQKQLDTAVKAVSSSAEEGQTVSQEAVINAMIQGEIAAQIAQEAKIPLTDGQRDAFLRTTNLAPLLDVAGAKPILYDVADTALVSKQLGQAPFLAQLAKRSVKLNPRYGVLDPKQKAIVTDQTGSLSKPVAVKTP